MTTVEKKDLLEYEILKHVEKTSRLTNRIAASKLECSVKLAHELLKKMVEKGLLHIKKKNSRRWDYFLTPKGIIEKGRLTYDFLGFSMHFYHEARKNSSQVCKEIIDSGKKTVALVGTGELAEIAYLGIKEWDLELNSVYGDKDFMGIKHKKTNDFSAEIADAIIICEYDKKNPLTHNYLPNNLGKTDNMYWVF